MVRTFAEREGFEPPDLLQSVVFKTTAIDHSAISLSGRKYTTVLIFVNAGRAIFPQMP